MAGRKKIITGKTKIKDLANEQIRAGSFWSLVETLLGVSGYVLANSLGISHGKYAGFKRGGMFHPKYLVKLSQVWSDRVSEEQIFSMLEDAKFRNSI